MANLRGWKVDSNTNIVATFTEDIAPGLVVKWSSDSIAIAGAGDVPEGVCFTAVDISENDEGAFMTSGVAKSVCASAVTDLALPLKPAAAGTVTPATTTLDACIGWPLNLAAIGEEVAYRVQKLYYVV